MEIALYIEGVGDTIKVPNGYRAFRAQVHWNYIGLLTSIFRFDLANFFNSSGTGGDIGNYGGEIGCGALFSDVFCHYLHLDLNIQLNKESARFKNWQINTYK